MSPAGLFLVFVACAVAQRGEVSIDCGADESVTVRWSPALGVSQKVDPSRALLGNCAPSFVTPEDTLLFYVSLRDCGFVKQVTADRQTFSNMLIYDPRPGLPFVSQPVQCVYDSAVVKATAAGPEQEDEDGGEETFTMEIMNRDFSASAPSTSFTLGSRIPIRAAVESPRPLRIFMESCVISTDADLSRAARVHPVINNSGCLMDSKVRNSSFVVRRRPDEMRLYLEAFEFAVGENVFLHCDLTAWDVQSLNVHRKVCHYMQPQRRWELLDDPSQSYACSCCDSSCSWRSDAGDGVSARKVLGPFVMVDESQSNTSQDTSSSPEHASLTAAPLWLLVFAVAASLVIVMGVLAFSYYLCFWRGGRLGYRPSRDLLTKH